VEPSPTGKPRSRDPKDDPILGTAVSAGARLIISLDNDLLVLEKPFGIAILLPRQFLAHLQRPI
jgi:predicted nucleic acid-binding protein